MTQRRESRGLIRFYQRKDDLKITAFRRGRFCDERGFSASSQVFGKFLRGSESLFSPGYDQ
jgi:hypothetical protein